MVTTPITTWCHKNGHFFILLFSSYYFIPYFHCALIMLHCRCIAMDSVLVLVRYNPMVRCAKNQFRIFFLFAIKLAVLSVFLVKKRPSIGSWGNKTWLEFFSLLWIFLTIPSWTTYKYCQIFGLSILSELKVNTWSSHLILVDIERQEFQSYHLDKQIKNLL